MVGWTLAQVAYGLAADNKPLTMPGGGAIPVGSSFVELDTGSSYRWDGTAWIASVVGDPVSVVGAVNTELGAGTSPSDLIANPSTAPVVSLMMGWTGAVWERFRMADRQWDINAQTIGTVRTAIAGAVASSGKKIRLMGGFVSFSVAASLLFEEGVGSGTGNGVDYFRTPKLLADTPFAFVVNGGSGVLAGTADGIIQCTAGAAGALTGTLFGMEQ